MILKLLLLAGEDKPMLFEFLFRNGIIAYQTGFTDFIQSVRLADVSFPQVMKCLGSAERAQR